MNVKKGFEADFLEVLVNLKYIVPEEAIKLLTAYKESDIDQLNEFLLGEGIVEKDQLLQALSYYYKVPSFDVNGYFFETHLLRMFPKDMLLRNEIIPLQVDENMMIMISAHPDDSELLYQIGENVSYDIRFYVGIARDICDAIKEYYDKADTQDPEDEDVRREHFLFEDFQAMEDAEDIVSYPSESNEAPYPLIPNDDEEDDF